MKKQNKDIGAIKKTIDELCTPNGISIGNANTKYTPEGFNKREIDVKNILSVLDDGNDVIIKAGSTWHKYIKQFQEILTRINTNSLI